MRAFQIIKEIFLNFDQTREKYTKYSSKTVIAGFIFLFVGLIFFLTRFSNYIQYTRELRYMMSHQLPSFRLEFRSYKGDYAIFHYYGPICQIFSLFSEDKSDYNSTIAYGYYIGTFLNDTDVYCYIKEEVYSKNQLYLSLASIVENQTELVYYSIHIPYERSQCFSYKFILQEMEDTHDGCVHLQYLYRGRGRVYGYYLKEYDPNRPDTIDLVREGSFLGFHDHESFDAIYCNLLNDVSYIFYIGGEDVNCTSPVHTSIAMRIEVDKEIYWKNRISFSLILSIFYSKFILLSVYILLYIFLFQVTDAINYGINYRRYDGVFVPDRPNTNTTVSLGVQFASKESQEPTILPLHGTYNDTLESQRKCEADVNRGIRFRAIEKNKKNINMKLIIIGNGDLFIYYTMDLDTSITSKDIQKNGQFLGYYKDEFIFVQLKDIENERLTIYVVLVCKEFETDVVSASI